MLLTLLGFSGILLERQGRAKLRVRRYGGSSIDILAIVQLSPLVAELTLVGRHFGLMQMLVLCKRPGTGPRRGLVVGRQELRRIQTFRVLRLLNWSFISATTAKLKGQDRPASKRVPGKYVNIYYRGR